MTEAVQRRLSTLLVADVVGYSRLVGEDETGTVTALRDRWSRILEPSVAGHGGRIVKYMGDGALVEFSSAINGVQCGLDIQTQMAQANARAADLPQITLRIGINLGDVIVDGADILGDDVNIAARLETLAEPGQLCISSAVYEAIRGKLKLQARDLGDLELKNISRLIRAYQVAPDGLAAPQPKAAEPQEELLSIAVLPFDNMSGVPEQDHIGDGISESIIADLSRFRDIAVIARNSSFVYKGKATRIQDIRRELGANYILEGSVQKAGDRIRVTAQLIDGASGKHIWAERYDRRVDDLFGVMDEITELIVGTLGSTYGGRLRKVASEAAVSAGPTSFRAFDHFVQGLQQLNKYTRDSLELCFDHFDRALAINPNYAKVLSKLTWAHLVMVNFGWADDPAWSRARAREAALAAVAADEAEAWAHWSVAGCDIFDGRHERALSGMRRAMELNPNDADVITDMALFCSWAGLAEDGIVHALKAMRINPHHPEYYEDSLGMIYFDAGQYENAIRTLNDLPTLNTPTKFLYLAASYAALGRMPEAKAAVARLLVDEPEATIALWTDPTITPYAKERDREHLAQNLRLAGLAE